MLQMPQEDSGDCPGVYQNLDLMLCRKSASIAKLQTHFRDSRLTRKIKSLNDASLVLIIVLANNGKEVEEFDKKSHIASEALNAMMSGISAVYTMERTPTPFTEPTTAKLLAKQSEDRLCRQLASTIGTPCSDYSFNCNGFLICVAHIDGEI